MGEHYICTACGETHVEGCVNLSCPVGFHNVASMHPHTLERAVASVEGNADPLESTRQGNYELGKVSTLEGLGPRFRKMAGVEFANGKDNRAKLFRDLAEEFETEAKAARGRYEKAKLTRPGHWG
jgi:hypothetical protein